MNLVPIVQGRRAQWASVSLCQAAKELAQAHRQGHTWDARVRTEGQGQRLLTQAEGAALVAAIQEELCH